VDTIEDIADAANAMFEHFGLPLHNKTEYIQWVGNGIIKFIERALSDDDPDQVQTYVAAFREIYNRGLHHKSRLYDGFPAVLNELTKRGIRLSVLSNKPDYFTKKIVRYYLSHWPFHPVFGQREGVPRKPDPAAALEIAEQMNLEASNFLFVGDSDTDIHTALAAGMVPVCVTWGYGQMENETLVEEVTFIDHPGEILSLLT